MSEPHDPKDVRTTPEDHLKPVEFSNAVRLTGREWVAVIVFAVLLAAFASSLWKKVEPFTPDADYRIPSELGNDYWLYQRHAALAAEKYDTLLIGDSVIWGDYVTRHETLSHYLNEQEGRERYANLGLLGTHPLALEGLITHYAGSVRGKNVVLHCNPLWLSSPKADLQDDSEVNKFNHPSLVPQFSPHVPAYRKEISPRLGVLVEQRTPLGPWTNHLEQAYYDRSDIPAWTLEHPYDDPVKPLTRGLPSPDEPRRHDRDRSWKDNDVPRQDYPWVDLQTSLQWAAFRRTVNVLRQRGNHVFVVVGPFNEHMLTDDNAERYQNVKATIEEWLKAEQVPYLAPPPLPSERYGDASHPLAPGYEMLARQLLTDPIFRQMGR
jgi:hypothetical protein